MVTDEIADGICSRRIRSASPGAVAFTPVGHAPLRCCRWAFALIWASGGGRVHSRPVLILSGQTPRPECHLRAKCRRPSRCAVAPRRAVPGCGRGPKVIRHVREGFFCRACETVVQAPAPYHPISHGGAGAGLLAHVIVSKFTTTSRCTARPKVALVETVEASATIGIQHTAKARPPQPVVPEGLPARAGLGSACKRSTNSVIAIELAGGHHQSGQPIEVFAHIRGACREPNMRSAGHRDHRVAGARHGPQFAPHPKTLNASVIEAACACRQRS